VRWILTSALGCYNPYGEKRGAYEMTSTLGEENMAIATL